MSPLNPLSSLLRPPGGLVISRFALVLALFFGLDQCLWAADAVFPRGPGFYFSPYKLFLLFLFFLIWVNICTWVNDDVQELGMETTMWNPLMLGSGLLGFLVLWILPTFWLGFAALILLFTVATMSYVNVRNQKC